MRFVQIAVVVLVLGVVTGAHAKKPLKVNVTNLPAVQPVEVQNLPAVQPVQVQNFPQSVATPLAPTKPSQLVTAFQNTGPACPGGGFTGARLIESQLLSDGTVQPLVIPTGQVFVITGVEAHVSTTASSSDTVRVGIPCGAGCMRGIFDVQVTTNASGDGAGTLQLTNGVAVKPGVTLCSADFRSSANAFATLRGFFAVDE